MLSKNLLTIGIWGLGIPLGSMFLFASSVQAELPEQMPGWCKNEVVGRFNTYMADISITSIQDTTVSWQVESTGRTGKCLFNQDYKFVRIVVNEQDLHYRATGNIYWNAQAKKWIAPDGGICHTCTPANGFPNPPKSQDGFFYLPNEKLWYEPDGAACYSCTPSNGFPVPPR